MILPKDLCPLAKANNGNIEKESVLMSHSYSKTKYAISTVHHQNAAEFSTFLNHLREHHWSLTSYAYRRRAKLEQPISPEDVIESDSNPGRIGTLLLRREGRIISSIQIDDKHGDGTVAIFSEVNTLPEFQKRGIFARTLGEASIRQICQLRFDCIELTTWTFNRKGIPLYKRAGFRAIPGTSLLMQNYIPLILKHPDATEFFLRNDFLRTLQNDRNYGYDRSACGEGIVDYSWESREESMEVSVDWTRSAITSISNSIGKGRREPQIIGHNSND